MAENLGDQKVFRNKIAELLADVGPSTKYDDDRDGANALSLWEPGSPAHQRMVPGSSDTGAPSIPGGVGLNPDIPNRSVDPQMLQWMQLGMPVKKGI